MLLPPDGIGDRFYEVHIDRGAGDARLDAGPTLATDSLAIGSDATVFWLKGRPHPPSQRPVSSYYGNYVLWESAYPLVDLSVAGRVFPGLTPRAAAERSTAEPALNQVYLRYIGPA